MDELQLLTVSCDYPDILSFKGKSHTSVGVLPSQIKSKLPAVTTVPIKHTMSVTTVLEQFVSGDSTTH